MPSDVGLALPRTQTSLFRYARKGRREGDTCHGPLRFVTSHSRLVLASAMRKTKRLRRRLYVAWPVPGSKKASEERNSERGKRAGREGRAKPVNINPPAHCPTDFLKKTFRVSKCKIVKTAKGAAFLTFLWPGTAF